MKLRFSLTYRDLKTFSASVTSILDWFHLSIKIQNIALAPHLKAKLLTIKRHLWRGKVGFALVKLEQLAALAKAEKDLKKLEKLSTYIKKIKIK